MRGRTPILVLVLSLTFLMAIPTPSLQVNAVLSNPQTSWSPFGPWNDNLQIQFYSDFQSMFNAFATGQIDITDWPVQPSDLSTFCSNAPASADYFCTSQEGELGVFQLDMNQHVKWAGVSQQDPRVKGTVGIINSTISQSPVCSATSGNIRVIVHLDLVENGKTATINDTLNTVTITYAIAGSPSATVQGSLASNTYTFPCLLAGPYTVRTSVYSGSANTTSAAPGNDVTVNLGVNYNSGSSAKPSIGGTEIRRAIAHLLDKPSFLNVGSIGGFAQFDDIQAAPGQGLIPCTPNIAPNCGSNMFPPVAGPGTPSELPQSVLDEDCQEHPWFNSGNCHPVSAYNLQSDVVGCGSLWWAVDGCGIPAATIGYSGPTDIRAACDHFLAAGFTLTGGTCQDLGNVSTGSTPPACANSSAYTCPYLVSPAGPSQQVTLYVRSSRPRRAFGQIMGDSLNFMFGTPNHQANNAVTKCFVNYGFLSTPFPPGCAPAQYTVAQVSNIVFSISPPGGTDDWNMFTGSYSLGNLPDHLWALYNSQFTGSICNGIPEGFPTNYQIFCDPSFDGDTSAGEFSSTLASSNSFFARAALTAHRDVMTMPVYSGVNQYVGLNSWNFQPGPQSSLVSAFGHGFQAGFNSLLNMRCNIAFAPSTAGYGCGGGVTGLIRRGFSQDVLKLSPFQAVSPWEFEVIEQVYDSMLFTNPRTGAAGSQVIDWQTKTHTSNFNPVEQSCVPRPSGTSSCTVGTTTQVWTLRNDLKFHDGTAVTADDVCFTILTMRDVPSSTLGPSVSTVAACNAVNPTTVQVKLQQESPFYEEAVGGLPILPSHLWQGPCSWIASRHDSSTEPPITVLEASSCADPAFDPMAQGIYLGDGPWECLNGSGSPGGPCSSSGTQAVSLGGTVGLTRFSGYVRCCPNVQGSSYQKLSWADRNDDGTVNILDIADAALHFGSSDSYWDQPAFGITRGVVDIGEIATIAFYYEHGTTRPYTPGALTALDSETGVIPAVDNGLDQYEKIISGSSVVGNCLIVYDGSDSNNLYITDGGQKCTSASLWSATATKIPGGGTTGSTTAVRPYSNGILQLNWSAALSSGTYKVSVAYNGSTIYSGIELKIS